MIADFFSSVFNATLENPRFSLNDPEAYDLFAGGNSTEAGISVTPEKALCIAAVWQAATMISGDVSLCTPNVHVRGDDAEIDEKHVAEWIIAYEWNDETPQDEGWERLVLHALIWGDGYAYIERGSRKSPPKAMFNLLPDRTVPARQPNGDLFYITQVDGQPEPLYPEEVFHLKGPSICNDEGMFLVEKAREAFGLSLAAQNFSSKFFANGSQSAGILEIPSGWTETAAKNLEEGFTKRTAGTNNWFKTVILRDGAKFHSTTIDAQKSQTGELRDAQVREVARFFNMPPSMLGVQDSVSYNSQEQARLAYKQQCLAHWLKRIRGQAEMKLLSPEERRGKLRYIDHNTTKLIEVDAKAMAEILQIERNAEVINANDWRRKINLPKRKDPGGEKYENPNTKSAASQAAAEPAKKDPVTTGTGSRRLSTEARAVCEDAINRMARRVCFDARSSAKKPTKLQAWVDSSASEHRGVFTDAVMPAAKLAGVMVGTDGEMLCHAWGGKFFAALLAQIDMVTKPPYAANDLEKNVDEKCRAFEAIAAADLLRALD
jgi:HK97 family phage portal protein